MSKKKTNRKPFTIRLKGKLEKTDNTIVNDSYFFNQASKEQGKLIFREGTSRAIRLFLSEQGLTKSQMLKFAESHKESFSNSSLFEGLRTKKGYTEKGKTYTYKQAIENLRPSPIRQATDKDFKTNRKTLLDVKIQKEKS